jgi:hypothetical protein
MLSPYTKQIYMLSPYTKQIYMLSPYTKQIYMLSPYTKQIFLEYEPKTHQHMCSQNVPTGKKYNQFRIKLELGNF